MADYYGTDTVVSELREDGLLIIRINRPDMANALNGATSKAMENIMNNPETDPAVRAIIVTVRVKYSALARISPSFLKAENARLLLNMVSVV
ncbi:MAG: enoyl-CoA hydratase-related protein [Eggerthellaceae bacterium]|nr:enoyl-CoA hydratase-related protein [Eggerthellaceae bacterium]